MINEYGKDENQKEIMVRDLGVFELRGLARELGIASPTTKKREELIELILNIVKNGESIEHVGKRKGRPYKKLSSIEEIVYSMTNDYNSNKMPQMIEFESLLTFAQESPVFGDFDNENQGVFEGIIRDNKEDYFTFYDKSCDKWIYIKNELTGYEKLMAGDKVKVQARGLGSENQYEATKIIQVNDIEIDKYSKETIEKGEEIINNDEIKFADRDVVIGRRNAYKKDEEIFENDNFNKFVKFCNDKKYKLITVGVNISFEDKIAIKKENLEDFTTVYGSKSIENFNMVIDAINYCQRLVDGGEKVVLFVTDIIAVLRGVNECFSRNSEEYSEQSLVVVRKLLSLGRAYKNNDCTLIVCYSDLDSNDSFLINDVLKISKNI